MLHKVTLATLAKGPTSALQNPPHAPRATGVDGVNHLTGAGPKTILLYGPYI